MSLMVTLVEPSVPYQVDATGMISSTFGGTTDPPIKKRLSGRDKNLSLRGPCPIEGLQSPSRDHQAGEIAPSLWAPPAAKFRENVLGNSERKLSRMKVLRKTARLFRAHGSETPCHQDPQDRVRVAARLETSE